MAIDAAQLAKLGLIRQRAIATFREAERDRQFLERQQPAQYLGEGILQSTIQRLGHDPVPGGRNLASGAIPIRAAANLTRSGFVQGLPAAPAVARSRIVARNKPIILPCAVIAIKKIEHESEGVTRDEYYVGGLPGLARPQLIGEFYRYSKRLEHTVFRSESGGVIGLFVHDEYRANRVFVTALSRSSALVQWRTTVWDRRDGWGAGHFPNTVTLLSHEHGAKVFGSGSDQNWRTPTLALPISQGGASFSIPVTDEDLSAFNGCASRDYRKEHTEYDEENKIKFYTRATGGLKKGIWFETPMTGEYETYSYETDIYPAACSLTSIENMRQWQSVPLGIEDWDADFYRADGFKTKKWSIGDYSALKFRP